ncbi:MAG: IS3 family transposase [Gemmatimonas sp.]|uniref:IS3 family transposase n=1 Tax=Gemmatimonas sp. TaxID=1962908 RepID=UPI00391F23DE
MTKDKGVRGRGRKPFSAEVRERAVRLVREQRDAHPTQWAAIWSIAEKIGCTAERLRLWVRQAEREAGQRLGVTTDERERLQQLERENRELKRANEILRKASAFFGRGGERPLHEVGPAVIDAFIDAERGVYGVEPICAVLQVAPSGYCQRRAVRADATRPSPRVQRDAALLEQIRAVFRDHHEVDGVRKIWHQLQREGVTVARCTVARLMRLAGLHGVVRGRRTTTTRPDTATPCPEDLVQRPFTAERPNPLWVADFTYVATWRGFVYVAFVVDVFSRRIVGWRALTTMRADLVLDALEQALHERELDGRLVVHSDRGSQDVAMRYTTRLADAGAAPSVGSAGDAYDNALAESIIGLYKTEVIHRRGPWKGFDDVECATLEWVAWFNTRRILEPLGYVSPAEFEEQHYRTQAAPAERLALN